MIAIKNVLVAPDFSPVAETALVNGRALARTFGGRLHVRHTVLRVSSSTAKAIVDYAKEASIDVIVIGATNLSAADRTIMGSVADKVARRAPCPVLAVHHPEHEFVMSDVLRVVARHLPCLLG